MSSSSFDEKRHSTRHFWWNCSRGRTTCCTSRYFSHYEFTLDKQPFFGYRLFHSILAKPRARDQYSYPFVDILLINDTESRQLWPQEPLPYGCFDRLVDVPFGHLTLRSLSSEDAKRHLDENYGKDWPYVTWRDNDHYYCKGVSNTSVKLRDQHEQRPVQHSKVQQRLIPRKLADNQHNYPGQFLCQSSIIIILI